MESTVFEVIQKLEQIKKHRISEGGLLSEYSDDEIIILIDSLISALKTEYLFK